MAKQQQCSGLERFVSAEIGRSAPLPLPHIGSRRVLRTIRRSQLRAIVPLSDTTIYEMEQRGEFPRRFNLTPRCVVWDLAEVEAWIEERRTASSAGRIERGPAPNVRLRKTRPVKSDRE
ncbi:Phage transcriptional regulator AlpA [Mesorhizobium plurifarium]|uniref:Phage transcriptional regulator AlpA n=1 Tax=Mesorhizobium plurifarium TaxID=69974 RepID=A0A090FNR8_MESPL|nr:Phage transcriptional regulator AlpA [Mesorhizobium plurifarium]